MPIDIVSTAIFDGTQAIPGWDYFTTYGPALAAAAATKYYFAGASNTFKRELHGRVYIITGGTSGLGASVAYELALKGAQIILLSRSTDDAWTVEFIEDLRDKTNNFMIYAEHCDLSSLHSVRLFATKWLDNQPPRRLDGVICCAADCLPRGRDRQVSVDGVENQLAVNYLAHYHLLTLLKPSLQVQPPDRDVRVILTTCTSQAAGSIDKDDILWESRQYPVNSPWKVFGTSKLLLGMFGRRYQRLLNDYERKDNAPCNIKISIVNPGTMRSPSTRRFISMGTIWGLFLYILLYPIWYIFFKDTVQGAQSLLFAIYAPMLGAQDGGNIIQECKILTKVRAELTDDELQEEVFQKTAEHIEKLEKSSAIERKKQEKKLGLDKKKEEAEKKKKEDVHEKPETEEDLQYKLDMIRKSMGISSQDGDMPLFPEEGVEEAKKKHTQNATGKKPRGKARKR
ncbi:hypothetical protein FT663_04274 [Candidozyma haemuli var. vulneris]|uniref:Ketoreductase (KR) domain-containing protein n=1 Tax=Candidozyma haemuli TaxID=45357 RepID=A0A2V1ANZ7_9ASCO|nr:hypothetical protein CXQ85_003638 [[Candida] haemuloni]KAF3986772.1 hypothetical protein FT662_04382 [[Candida] haemuloni var. vulneris]KAF3987881.1 hypothetical protein FT663_04274 [[Candida] haemuloni var. vulneris]PVH19780.1 hypothetical protein CXQ85_003638 [[Candida] haemuloni]